MLKIMQTRKLTSAATIILFVNCCGLALSKAISDAPAIEFNNRGVKKLNRGDDRGALDEFSKAIDASPNYDLGFANRALVKMKFHDYSGSMSDFDAALRVSPKCLPALAGRARLKDLQGNYAEAIKDYSQLIAIGQYQYYHNRGEDKQKLGDKVGAAKDFKNEEALSAAYPAEKPHTQQ